jgi:2-polyprenyl-3-methyl-5-hydroxy-6-metoxy-1,4-benzoquinol methylase
MYNTKSEAINCQKGDICLVEDLDTGLIYNKAFNVELMKYDDSYQNEQAISESFKKHLNSVLSIIKKFLGKNNLVEIGCGKAHFLELLQSNDFNIKGFDPTYEGSNPVIKKTFFENSDIKVDGIILRHVLEHIQNPVNFLQKISKQLKNDIYIYRSSMP